MPTGRASWVVVRAFVPALLALAVIAGFPLVGLVLPVYSPGLGIATETGAALIALLVSYLMFGRFRQQMSLRDLLIVYGMLVLAFSNVFFSALPAALAGGLGHLPALASLIGLTAGAGLLTAAAFTPQRPIDGSEPAWRDLFGIVVAVIGILGTAVALTSIAPGSVQFGADRAGSTTVLEATIVMLFGVASAGFAVRAERTSDDMLRWLAVGTALAAAARLTYMSFPSSQVTWLSAGDLLRIGFYLTLAIGAAREIGTYWRRLADAAVADERRRMARELHDGLAQELAYISGWAETQRARQPDDGDIRQISNASQRALDEARRAIAALTRHRDDPLDIALTQTAEEVAGRLGVQVLLDIQEGITPARETVEALLRVTREAMGNAVRHGQADTVSVHLWNGEGVTLKISDDGGGFAPGEQLSAPGHLGILSMQERIEAVGGKLGIRTGPYGTDVQVHVPLDPRLAREGAEFS